jgi:AraC-like DNA-binding protein
MKILASSLQQANSRDPNSASNETGNGPNRLSVMKYSQIKPSAAVSRYVDSYWTLEDNSPTNSIQRIIPDGRPELIINFARPFENLTRGEWQSQPACFFVGQITSPLLLRPPRPAQMLGIDFRPHGAEQLLRLPMSELTDSVVALEDLSRRLFRQMEWVRDLSSLPEAVAALDRILAFRADRIAVGHNPVSYAVSELQRTAGLLSVKEVAHQIGWSTRQLQRRFKDAVGISPKLFARMQRFQRVFRAMDDRASGWIDTHSIAAITTRRI